MTTDAALMGGLFGLFGLVILVLAGWNLTKGLVWDA